MINARLFPRFYFYWDAIVPFPIEMANGLLIMPNEVFAEPDDGVSCKTNKMQNLIISIRNRISSLKLQGNQYFANKE